MDYDRQGNFTFLNRYGIKTHGWSNTYTPNNSLMEIDNLYFTYDGNRIRTLRDDVSDDDPTYTGAQDFHGGGDQQVGEYNYDANGNLFSDFNKGLATIKYNILNLPDTVQHVNGHLLSNSYDATGDKFLAIHRTMNGSGVSMQAGWTYYKYPTGYTIANSTSLMYLDNSEYFSYNLDKILTDDGILVRTNDYSATTPVMGTNYFIRDHLGNVRVVFGDSGSIRQVNNYYPFGMEYGESAQTLTELNYQNYLYGGKELDRKFGINAYDFTGRYYDLTDNRFWSMDPMAEKYYSISPYAYCGNNPVRFFDPDGMDYYGLDENTKRLSLVQSNKDKTDLISSGSYDEKGNFKPNNANIRISKGVLNATDMGQDLSEEGFTTKGGNQKDGIDLMSFISTQTGVELAGKGFTSPNGKHELKVADWKINTTKESHTPSFERKNGIVDFDVHTHPIGKNGSIDFGFGIASERDFAATKYSGRAYYILSERDGLVQYFPAAGRGKTIEVQKQFTISPSYKSVPKSLRRYLGPTTH